MNRARSRRLTGFASAVLAGAAMLVVAVPTSPTQAAAPGDEGLSCTDPVSTAAGGETFELDATSGYISTPDGNSIYMWSYAPYTAAGVVGAFQLPGPTLCVTAGDTVTVTVHNKLPEATSVLFPGQQDVRVNASPAQPEVTNGVITSLTNSTPKGGTVSYTFTAGDPGTYLYSSGTDVTKQRQMGLYGGLVVHSATAGQANAATWSTYNTEKEYLYLLSDIDPDLHLAVERNRSYNYAAIRARYFLINGRSMPDTLAPNHAAWLPYQPYGALVHIQPYDPVANPRSALIRYLNAGSVNYPFHPHGSNQTVITRDGVPTEDATRTAQASYDKFLIDVAPGQSIDTLEKFTSEYSLTESLKIVADQNPDLVIPSDIQLPQLQDQIVGPGTETWFSENPYLGGAKGALPNGIIQNNECGEYYHVAHSHALEQATNFGASFGGMMTLIRIDPPSGCP